jgi:hypothetical protein
MKLLLLSVYFSQAVFATPYLSENVTYQGRIISSAGVALENASAQFSIQILSPGTEQCILLDELHTVNMTGSNGYFTINIGKGQRTGTDPNLNFSKIFQNSTTLSNLYCATGSGQTYTPASGAERKVRVKLYDGTQWVNLDSDYQLSSVPQAVVAESLQNKVPDDFIQVTNASSLTQANIESVFSRFTKLDAILNNANAGATSLGTNITGNAATATTASNVSGTVGLANGGTGATTATSARSNLGLGALAIMSPSGTADATTFLRGDGSWVTPSGGSTNASDLLSGTLATARLPAFAGGDVTSAVGSGTLTLNTVGLSKGGTGATTASDARTNLGLGSLATKSIVDLSSSDASGTLAAARVPAFTGDVSNTAGSLAITVAKIQGYDVVNTAPTDGKFFKYIGSATNKWTPSDIKFSDIKNAVGNSAFVGMGTCTVAQTVKWSSLTDTFECQDIVLSASQINTGTLAVNQIPNLDAGKINSGVLATAQIPSLDAGKTSTGVFDSARLPAAASNADGIVNQIAQSFSGIKTFVNNVIMQCRRRV